MSQSQGDGTGTGSTIGPTRQRGSWAGWAGWAGMLACGGALVATISVLVWQPRRGLDPTDEASYLLATGHPREGAAFNGLFGDYTGMLLHAVGNDLGRFRVAGVLLLVAAFVALGCSLVPLLAAACAARRHLAVLVPVACAAAGLLQYSLFIRTPNYNWLALCGAALVCTGIARALHDIGPARRAWATACLIAAGTFLAFWGKSTTGVGTALVAVVVVIVAAPAPARDRVRLVARAAAVGAVLVLLHFIFVTGPSSTLSAYRRSGDVLSQIDPAYYAVGSALLILLQQLIGLPAKLATTAGPWLLAALVPLVALGSRRAGWTVLVTAASASVIGVGLIVTGVWRGTVTGYYTSAAAMIAMLLTALIGWLVGRRGRPGAGWHDRRGWMTLALVGAAGAYAFGSNNGIVAQLSGAAGLLLSGVVVLTGLPASRRVETDGVRSEPAGAAEHAQTTTLPTTMLAGVLCAAALTVTLQARAEPYRIAPMEELTEQIDIGRYGGEVLVDEATAETYRTIRDDAVATGWRSGTPLIDMSFTPSVPLVLDAEVPLAVLPLVGGLTTGTDSTIAALRYQEPAWVDEAWLLIDPTSVGVEVSRVLAEQGRSLEADYALVTTAPRPLYGELALYRPTS